MPDREVIPPERLRVAQALVLRAWTDDPNPTPGVRSAAVAVLRTLWVNGWLVDPAALSTPAGPRDNVGGLDGVGAERARAAGLSTPQPARWKCPNCGPRHAHKIAHESHSQIPYCRRCGNDAVTA